MKSGISPLDLALLPDVILLHQTNNTNPKKNKAMKTTKILSALGLVLIFAANSLFASRTTINDPGASDKQKLVTYQVNIKAVPNFPGANGQYVIVITDENGRKVVPGQVFHAGVWSYSFKEAGTFRGTRVAMLIQSPASPKGWIINPSKREGTFTGGSTYQFNLIPESTEIGGIVTL